MENALKISSNILRWAVTRAGYDVSAYESEDEKFAQWLDGSKTPTIKQLQCFAKKMYVPFSYLFLQNPPTEDTIIPFFRSVTNTQSLNVLDAVRLLQYRQDWLSDYLKKEDYDTLDFVDSVTINTSIDNVCKKIQRLLNLNEVWATQERDYDSAIKKISTAIESLGIAVCFNSVVGFSNNRSISVAECRGFSLCDKYAPFIFINSKDAKSAQVFTLLHEFVHILIGRSAGTGGDDFADINDNVEKFCDSVAANFLVPEKFFRNEWQRITSNRYELLSKKFKVSRYVVARRANDLGLISSNTFFALYKQWNLEPKPQKHSGGGSFYPMAIRKTSRLLLTHLNNAIGSNKILHLEAYRIAGMRGDTFEKVIKSKEFLGV